MPDDQAVGETSLAPGSKVVTDYYQKAGLTPYLEALGFHLAGYGCTTCIGNSGPLPAEVSAVVQREDLVAASVLSGNRNFERRINSEVRANYLMSPPLVVAFAIAGRIDIDLTAEQLGHDGSGNPVFLRDIWPSAEEVERVIQGRWRNRASCENELRRPCRMRSRCRRHRALRIRHQCTGLSIAAPRAD